MSGYMPFFNKRRHFLQKSSAVLLLSALNPMKLFSKSSQENTKMIEVIKKNQQFNDVIFGGRFLANKAVYSGQSNVKPFSTFFYWSNSVVVDDCEFGLHPHQGFEIMTFLFEGSAEHYDTASKVWTPLRAGDFQIIQSNSGIQHQEKVYKKLKGLQIWFDPNYYETIKLEPSYIDYHAQDFQPQVENGIKTLTYVGKSSPAKALTPGLTIKKLTFEQPTKMSLPLNEAMSYVFYVVSGKGMADGKGIVADDAIRISNAGALSIDFQGELFYAEAPTNPSYKTVWS